MKSLRAFAWIVGLLLTTWNLIGATQAFAQAPAASTDRITSTRIDGVNPPKLDIQSELARRLDYQQAAPAPQHIAATRTSIASGLWSAAGTWDTGVPGPGDDVVIADGTTVTIDTTPITVNSLTVGQGVSGVLQYDATARALTVTTDVIINTGGILQTNTAGAQTGHALSVGGNLTNNGTLDLSTSGNTSGASLTFTGAASKTFGGTGATTDLRTLIINKGTSNASILEITTSALSVQGTVADGAPMAFLTITNGTLKISGSFTLAGRTFATTGYTIPASGGFWLRNPNYTVSPQNASPILAGTGTAATSGLLRVSAGTYNIGTASGNSMGFQSGANVIVEGGSINAAGRFGVATAANALNYTQTGGTITVCTQGNTSGTLGSFDLGTGSGADPIIQGGTIIIRLAATAIDYRNEQSTIGASVTGGTVQFGDASSGAAKAFQANGIFPDVVISNASAGHSLTLRAPTKFFNNMRNVTINTGTTLNVGTAGVNQQLFISGSSTITNNGTLTCNSSASTNQLLFFTPGASCVYTGNGVSTGIIPTVSLQCGSLTMNQVTNLVVRRINIFTGNIVNANKLTLGDGTATSNVVQIGNSTTATAAGTFDTAPVFNLGTGGQQIFYLRTAAARSTGPEINPTRSLVFSTVDDNAVGPDHPLTISGGDVTVTNTLTLTNGRVVTGASKVIANGTVTRTNGYVDGNLQKPVAAAGTFAYEIGTANAYSPVSVAIASIGGGGNLTAKATAPSTPPVTSGVSTTKYVNRSYTLTNGGITTPNYAATFNFINPGDLVGGATPANLKIAKDTGGTWSYPAVGSFTGTSVTTAAGQTSFSDFYLAECPTITVAINKTDISCFGANDGTATASASGGAAPYTYSWTPGGPGASLSSLGPGSYTVTATDANGCTGSNSVTIIEPPAVTLSLGKTDPSCFGGNNGTVTATFGGGTGAFIVQIDGGGYSTQSSPYVFTGLSQGSHTVDIKDANNCPKSASITLNDPPAITLSLSPTDITCFGANDGKVQATFSGGTGTLQVQIDGGGYSAQASPYTFTGLGPGPHTVDVKDANNCVKSSSTNVNEPTQLTISAVPASSTVCTGGTTNVTVSASGGTPPYSGTGVFPQGAGTTTYTVTDANNCMASQDVTITITQYTITVTAGAGGSITPGTGNVDCGTNATYTISPDPGYYTVDVLVDAVSQGPIPSYTFNNVTTNHSISATFALIGSNTVNASGPTACITPAGPCQTVAVNISRTNTTPIRLFHVDFQLSPELQLCGTPTASVTEGTYLSSFNSNTSFFVTNNGGGSYTADGTINGAPCGQAAASGNLFNIAVTHTGSSGTGTVTITAVTLRDCSNNTITPTNIGTAGSVTIDLTPVIVASVTDPQTVQEQSTLTVTPSATQSSCAPGVLTWSVSPALPGTATFNPATGEIQWTPACGDAGPYGPFTLKATAPGGDYGTSNAFAINVTHKVGTVAVNPITDPQVVAEGSTLTITPTANTTPCAGAPLTWSVAPPLPGGASFNSSNGEITWTPSCSQSGTYGPFTLTATAATSESGNSNAFSIKVTDVPSAIGAATGVTAAQVLTGNPSGQTTGITVNFTSPGGATAIKVYRAGFGNYPEYDDAGGAPPAQPGAYPPPGPWTATLVTTSGGVDNPGTRDYWYYVVYAQNACGDWSVASTMTGGTLDYHLGDVTDGFTPGTGDNLVQGEDVSALGGYYGMDLNPSDPYNYLDVGPTTTNYVDGRPTTDNKVNFEDLVMFAINYSVVSGPSVAIAKPADGTSLVAASTDRLILHAPGQVTVGENVQVPITMEGTGSVQAMSIRLGWDPAVVRPVGQQAGALLYALNGLALSAKAGTVDVAALGHGQGIAGSGELATVTFEVIGAGDPSIRIEAVDARDQHNRAATINTSREVPLPQLPAVTALQMTSGNPSRQSVAFAVNLAQASNVDLSIYAVDGRRVAVLMSGPREPGSTNVTWDGRDDSGRPMSSGVFYVRLTAGNQVFKRTISYLR